MLYFAPLVGGVSELKRTIRSVKSIISRHFVEIQQSPWRSLPELTNHNGKVCPDSNPAQAWSVASILEVIVIRNLALNKDSLYYLYLYSH